MQNRTFCWRKVYAHCFTAGDHRAREAGQSTAKLQTGTWFLPNSPELSNKKASIDPIWGPVDGKIGVSGWSSFPQKFYCGIYQNSTRSLCLPSELETHCLGNLNTNCPRLNPVHPKPKSAPNNTAWTTDPHRRDNHVLLCGRRGPKLAYELSLTRKAPGHIIYRRG